MLTEALFTITRIRKQPSCPLTDDVHIFKLACSIKNISIVHGESKVFPETLFSTMDLRSPECSMNPTLAGMLTTSFLFLRILPPMGR